MPFCPLCSSRLKVTSDRCDNCGAEFNSKSGLTPLKTLDEPVQPVSGHAPEQGDELSPLLTPALSILLRSVATVIAAAGLALAGFFWLKGDKAALVLPLVVLTPVLLFQRKSTGLLLGLAVLAVLLGFFTCAANFRWAGG